MDHVICHAVFFHSNIKRGSSFICRSCHENTFIFWQKSCFSVNYRSPRTHFLNFCFVVMLVQQNLSFAIKTFGNIPECERSHSRGLVVNIIDITVSITQRAINFCIYGVIQVYSMQFHQVEITQQPHFYYPYVPLQRSRYFPKRNAVVLIEQPLITSSNDCN